MSSFSDSIQKFRDKLGSLGKSGGGGGGSSGGKSKVDAKVVLAWVKGNPVIVASIAVMIAAPVAAWWFSSQMHADADALTAEHAKELAALERLEKTPVEISLPGRDVLSQSGVVTPRMVAEYENLTGKLRADAIAVQRAALKHNQKNRTQLPSDIRITPSNVNTIAGTVHRALMASMQETLNSARAGTPPDYDRILDQVQRRQDQFIFGEKKQDRKSLSVDELAKLHAALAEKRLQVCADAAANLSFYADMATLGLPSSHLDAGSPPSEGRLFYWQWRAWMVEDVIRSLAKANQPYRSVVESPVKRLIGIRFLDKEDLAPPASANAAPPVEGAEAPVAMGPPPIDPKLAVPYQFSSGGTFTGRQTNSLYDVRVFEVGLVVTTRMLPEVLNAIARENFMTVIDVKLTPADAFAEAADGFVYGAEPVSRVILRIESVWLREWLGKLMPKELQAARGTTGKTVDEMAPASTEGTAPDAAAADTAASG